jgi:uncharacterized protein
LLLTALSLCAFPARDVFADGAHHTLWQIQGKHATVYLLGSVHVLRESDYPLPKPLLDAYADCKDIVMEIDLSDMESGTLQTDMMQAATLPDEKSLRGILGPTRYAHADAIAGELGLGLSMFEQLAPWFVAEAISQLQLMKLGFQPASGVEMYFLDKAKNDGKRVSGLETAADQIAVFQAMSDEAQANYLVSSLEESKQLPQEVDSMVSAWRRGDTQWFESQLNRELGRDPQLFQSVLSARNRKWMPKIEALLAQDRNTLIIVGTGHLVGSDSVVQLLKNDGYPVIQR